MLQRIEGTEVTDLTAVTDDGIAYGLYRSGYYWDEPGEWRWWVERRVDSSSSENVSIRVSGGKPTQEAASTDMLDAIERVRSANAAITPATTTE